MWITNFLSFTNNTRDTKLCTKIYTKSYVAIYMAMGGNIHSRLCQLKLNNMDFHVCYPIRFGVNFST